MILHSGEKTPTSANFTPDPLFKVGSYPAYVLPGWEEPLGALVCCLGLWVHLGLCSSLEPHCCCCWAHPCPAMPPAQLPACHSSCTC